MHKYLPGLPYRLTAGTFLRNILGFPVFRINGMSFNDKTCD